MTVAPGVGRELRDKYLSWAVMLLASAQVLYLIADSMRLTLLLESRADDAHKVAGWLDLISNLPLLAAASFGIVAFLGDRGERWRWLMWAFFLAGAGFAIAFVSSVVEYAALEGSQPEGMNLALLAGCLDTFALTAGFLLAAAAISGGAGDEDAAARDRRLRLPVRLAGVALLFGGLASWAYTLAYSDYPHNAVYTRGLAVEGIGALAAGLSLLYAASAFGRGGESRIARREKCLGNAALALGLSFLLVGLGRAGHASGTTAIGFAETSAIADWILALFGFAVAAALLLAARGFEVVSQSAQQG